MAGIDYGAVIFKNGKRYKEENLYPKIDELGICFYKCCVENLTDDNDYYWFYGETADGREKFAEEVVFNGLKIKVKKICNSVFTATIFHNGDRYNILFGYGIDCNMRVWNKIKNIYLGKQNAKKVDKWLKKRIDWSKV